MNEKRYTNEEYKIIVKMWNNGIKGIEIGKVMGCTPSYVRNVVRTLRLKGWEIRSHIAAAKLPKPKKEEPIAPPPAPPLEKPLFFKYVSIPDITPSYDRWVPIVNVMNGHCRYTADNYDWKFCNAPGFPWCEEHAKLCINPAHLKIYGHART